MTGDQKLDLTAHLASLLQLRAHVGGLSGFSKMLASAPPGFLDWCAAYGPEESDRVLGEVLCVAVGVEEVREAARTARKSRKTGCR